jgi:hypothetical protein
MIASRPPTKGLQGDSVLFVVKRDGSFSPILVPKEKENSEADLLVVNGTIEYATSHHLGEELYAIEAPVDAAFAGPSRFLLIGLRQNPNKPRSFCHYATRFTLRFHNFTKNVSIR